LSDSELDTFIALGVKAERAPLTGTDDEVTAWKPPAPEASPDRVASVREFKLRELGRQWEQVEAEATAPNAREAEAYGLAILDAVPMLHGKPLLRLDILFPTAFRYAQHLQRERDAVPVAVVPAPVDNVVPLTEAERERAAELRDRDRLDKLMTVNREPWDRPQ
jgi:hypothetical protein